ncbi:deoxyribose-phosphate aldolase [Mycoplasmopsis synoviae]|uniref:deoxyribose-phosphate aldolase n=1 Tax=Mycoplasmopsis synoviae TaxID=2109 RepID=UPI000375D2CB|nr:deoxyribose-phosphate aldolase [Mycoplasmopsis synoviae]AKB11180.1 deoxyribose-phosphate aldolase [Mycoplasmopsis synoviae ATCC 25204]
MNFNQLIDHTYLKPEATKKNIDNLIMQGFEHNFFSVCVNSIWVKYVKEKIKKLNSNLKITAVVGFPLGASITQAKAHEAKLAVEHGADEIDMVIAVGFLKQKDYEYVLNDIKSVKKAIGNKVLKIIIETALLTKEEIKKATEIVLKSGAEFIKTSTGFSYRGASLDDVVTMKSVIKDQKLEIKAAGGISTLEDMQKMHEAGATRFGLSKSVEILKNQKIETKY